MKINWAALILVSFFVFTFYGCETVKGAAKGFKQDLKNLKNFEEFNKKVEEKLW